MRHGTGRRQQHPVDELENRALAGAAAAHEHEYLACLDLQPQVTENRRAGAVTERHGIE
jgi:hypothetical protein